MNHSPQISRKLAKLANQLPFEERQELAKAYFNGRDLNKWLKVAEKLDAPMQSNRRR